MWCRWVQRIQKQTLDSTLDEKTWKNELWSVNQWWHLFGTALCTSKFPCLQCMTSWQPGIYSPLGANWSCWCQRSRFVTVTWLRTRRGRPLWALFRWLCSDVKICQVRCLLDLSYWKTSTCRQNDIGTQCLLTFNFTTQSVERPSTDSKCSCQSANVDFQRTCQSVVQTLYSRALVFHTKPIDHLKRWVYYRSYAGVQTYFVHLYRSVKLCLYFFKYTYIYIYSTSLSHEDASPGFLDQLADLDVKEESDMQDLPSQDSIWSSDVECSAVAMWLVSWSKIPWVNVIFGRTYRTFRRCQSQRTLKPKLTIQGQGHDKSACKRLQVRRS